jgi:hypothetical protein
MGQASSPISPGTQQLNVPTSAVASTSGAATFTFQAPPPGITWTGTLTVAGAPASAVFVAMVGATSWGDWAGGSVYGPVQCMPNQQLVVSATGLAPGASYEMVWAGSSDAQDQVQPIWPDTNTSAQQVQFGQATAVLPPTTLVPSGGTASATVTVPPGVRTLLLFLHMFPLLPVYGTVTNVSVLGTTSGIQYYNAPPYLGVLVNAAQNTNAEIIVPLPTNEASVTVTLTLSSNVVLSVFGDTAEYEENIFYNGTITPKSASLAAAGNSTLVTGPCRLLTANVIGNAATTLASINVNGVPVLSAAGASGGLDSNETLTFPDNTIVPAQQIVNLVQGGAGGSIGSITFAYP